MTWTHREYLPLLFLGHVALGAMQPIASNREPFWVYLAYLVMN